MESKNSDVLIFHPAKDIYGSERSLISFLTYTTINALCVCPADGPLSDVMYRLEVPTVGMEMNKYSFRQNPAWNFLFFIRVLRLVRSTRPSAIIINLDTNVVILTFISWLCSIPLIRFARFEFDPPQKRLPAWCWRQCSRIIAPSRHVQSQIQDWLGKTSDGNQSAEFIYDSIEMQVGNRTNLTQEPDHHDFENIEYVCFVGRIDPNKDILTLLTAFDALNVSYPALKLVIVGDHNGTDEGKEHYRDILQAVESLKMSDRVTFVGYSKSPRHIIRHSKALVLPSASESLGIVLLESWAEGVPTLASNVAGCRETTSLSGGGLLFEHGNHSDLAAKMTTLMDDESHWKANALKAQSWVSVNCNAKSYCHKLEEIILSAKKSSRYPWERR